MIRILTILLFCSLAASGQYKMASYGATGAVVKAGGMAGYIAGKSTITLTRVAGFFFGSTGSNTCSGFTKANYDPSNATTGATNNGVTMTNVATANWTGTGGTAAADGTGTNTWTGDPDFDDCTGTSNNTEFNSWFTLATYDHTKPQMILGNLIPGAYYTIKVTGSTNFGTVNARITEVRAEGGNGLSSPVSYNPGSSGSPNRTAIGTLINIQADGSGNITLFIDKTGSDRAIFSALVLYIQS